MSVEVVDITDDWRNLLKELELVERKWFYIFKNRILRPAKSVANQVAYLVPARPLSGLPPADPIGFAKIRQPGKPGSPRTLVKVGVSRLGWVQAADLVKVEGVFKSNLDAKFGRSGTSRWVLPELDRATSGLLKSIQVAIQRSWDDVGTLF